jgi:integrase
MARKILTAKGVKALKAKGKRYDTMDALVPGFGVRVTETGHRSYILVTRYPGSSNPARRTIGDYGAISLEQARDAARRWLELIAAGRDPRAEVLKLRREEQQRQADTFGAVAEEFIKRHVTKLAKAREIERDIRRELIQRWGRRPVTDITRRDVVELLEEVVDRGAPYQAHNLLGHVRKLFNWAIARDVYGLQGSPCDRLKPAEVIGKKGIRTRVLTDDELRAVWRAAGDMGYPLGPLFRLLILTGQRKSEVAEMSWPEIDFDKALWTIPGERMKEDAAQLVPLSPDAMQILKALPRWTGPFIFSTTAGKKPVNSFSKAKERIDRLSGIAGWKIHDLRRTMRTHLSALPVQDIVRELVIGHTKPGLHKVYDQHAYLDEKRHALELWAARLKSIVEPPPPNVVPLSA